MSPSRNRTKKRSRVLLTVEAQRAYGRQVAEGVLHYVQTHQPWDVVFERGQMHVTMELLERNAPIDGVITEMRGSDTRAVFETGIPFVSVEQTKPDVPQVHPDDEKIGLLAGEYLVGLGLEHYAYVGLPGAGFSDRRAETFQQEVLRLAPKSTAAVYPKPFHPRIGHVPEDLMAWLKELPKPCGLFVYNSHAASMILAALQKEDIAVPDEVAVLGVENDEILCELSIPSLTSIDHNTRRVGFEATGMLETLLQGGRPEPLVRPLPPKMVVERQSTDVLQTPDPDVVRAVRYIRDHACEDHFSVEDVVRAIVVPRRRLERRFRDRLACGIHEYITKVRIDRIKELLVETSLPMPDICARTGFSSPTLMSRIFRRETDITPSSYRQTHSMQ